MKWIIDNIDNSGNELGGESKVKLYSLCNYCGQDKKVILPKYNNELRLCDNCIETEMK